MGPPRLAAPPDPIMDAFIADLRRNQGNSGVGVSTGEEEGEGLLPQPVLTVEDKGGKMLDHAARADQGKQKMHGVSHLADTLINEEETMTSKWSKVNEMMVAAVKRGGKVSAAMTVEQILVEKMKELLANAGAGEGFLSSAIGNGLVLFAACYVGIALPALIDHQYAQTVADWSQAALEGRSRDLFTPLFAAIKGMAEEAMGEIAATGLIPADGRDR